MIEDLRKQATLAINAQVESNDEQLERTRLEDLHKGRGRIWDTQEMSEEYDVESFMTPFVIVRRRADGTRGTLMFQASPRFYFDFREE